MTQRLTIVVSIFTLLLVILPGHAQDALLNPTEAEAIAISVGDAPGTVTISGDAGSADAWSDVAVRNLYTGSIAYAQVGGDGRFAVTLPGLPHMPYHIANADIPDADQRAGLMPPNPALLYRPLAPAEERPRAFQMGGPLSYGGAYWLAEGTINASQIAPGDDWTLSLNVTFVIPDAAPDLDLSASALVSLRPLVHDLGQQISRGDGLVWRTTRSGANVAGVWRDIALGELTSGPAIRRDDRLTFRLFGTVRVPDDLGDGAYVPHLAGRVRIGDSAPQSWAANRVFSTTGDDAAPDAMPLPVLLDVATDTPPDQMRAVPLRFRFDNEVLPHLLTEAGAVETCADCLPSNLLLLPGALPGVPFVVGDVFVPMLQLAPALPADVSIQLDFWPLYGQEVITRQFNGRANAYGTYRADEIVRFDQPGEYQLAYIATHASGQARRITWGVVAPAEGALIAHGARGIRDHAGTRPAWYDLRAYPDDAPFLPPILNAPYFSGDVAYLPDSAAYALNPRLTVQDTAGAYAGYLRASGADIEAAARHAALPVRYDENGAVYGYLTATRPDVLVRQFVQGDARHIDAAWHPDETLRRQVGAGAQGHRPGDLVFTFGGAVVRLPDADIYETAGYASVAVVVEDDAPGGVRPAFDAPLLTLDDVVYDLVYLPTGARPGQVYPLGHPLTLAGQIAPPLPATVSARITSPSGRSFSLNATANPFGHIHGAQNAAVTLDEVGLWTVDVRPTYDQSTSVGPLMEPVTRGGVPGADAGRRYVVYAVDPGAPSLLAEPVARDEIPGQPINFGFDVPTDWTDVRAHVTVSTPSLILAQATLRAGTRVTYQYNPQVLARTFPQIETDRRTQGPAAGDVVTLTFAIGGMDADGQRGLRTQTYTLLHDRLLSSG